MAYSASLSERDEFMTCCEPLVPEHQCITGLAEEARELCAEVAGIEKGNTSAKSSPTWRQSRTRSTVSEKRVLALVVELKEAWDAQKRRFGAAKKSEKRATDVATQLAESARRLTEDEEKTKLATEK